jgi:hypothetical protein
MLGEIAGVERHQSKGKKRNFLRPLAFWQIEEYNKTIKAE